MSQMNNRIQEYFVQKETGQGNELFRIDDDNSDIKSEVSEEEVRYINVLMSNDNYLLKHGLNPVFKNYYKKFLRLQVSLKRQGRNEYVNINKKDNSDDTIKKLSDFQNLSGNNR